MDFDELDNMNFNTGDPRMILTPEEAKKRYVDKIFDCVDCCDIGVNEGRICHCDKGKELNELINKEE